MFCNYRYIGIGLRKMFDLASLALLQIMLSQLLSSRHFTSLDGVRGATKMVTWRRWASTVITFYRKGKTCRVVALYRARVEQSNLVQWPKSAPRPELIVAPIHLHTFTMTSKQCPSVRLHSLCTAPLGRRTHLLPRPSEQAAAPSRRRARRPSPFTDGVPSLVHCRYRLRRPSPPIQWVCWLIQMIRRIFLLRQRQLRPPIRTCNTGSTPLRLPPLSANDSTTSSSARVLGIGQLAPIRNNLIMEFRMLQLVAPSKINWKNFNMKMNGNLTFNMSVSVCFICVAAPCPPWKWFQPENVVQVKALRLQIPNREVQQWNFVNAEMDLMPVSR